MIVGLGIGVGFQRVSGGGAAFDSDYQAVLTYATSLGYTLPSSGQQIKQNQLMLDLKAGGIWNKLDTFAMFANDGSSNFALIDWKRLSLYTAVNSPAFSSNGGFTGNGTSSYINTNFNPSTNAVNYTLNNASFGGLVDIPTSNLGFFAGIASNTQNVLRKTSSVNQRINQGNSLTNTPQGDFSNYKFIALHRTSSMGGSYTYDNSIVNYTSASLNIPNENQLILRSIGTYANFQARFFWMGASLVSENTAFNNAINTYITSL